MSDEQERPEGGDRYAWEPEDIVMLEDDPDDDSK